MAKKKNSLLTITINLFLLLFLVKCENGNLETHDGSSETINNSIMQFVNVTKKVGLDFKHVHGGSGEKYYIETMGSGVAFLDYDNDGDLDIYATNGAPLPGYETKQVPTNRLYRNNLIPKGKMSFTDVTDESGTEDTSWSAGCAVGDFNNDGFVDIYITNFGANILYQNNGDGTFTDVTEKANVGDDKWSASAAFLDYDNDGDLDLYVVNYVVYSVDNNPWCGDKKLGVRGYCHPDVFDGIGDVLYRNDGVYTEQNNYNGVKFTEVTKSAGVYNPEGKGLGIVCGDYDNDGDIDIYVTNDKTRNYLYKNNGNGTFSDVTLLSGVGYSENGDMEAGMGTDLADFNNDGHLDLFVTNFSNETNTLYQNNGNDIFSDISFQSGIGMASLTSLGFGTAFFDYDLDNDLDIFVANGHVIDNIEMLEDNRTYAQANQLLENDGNGYFNDISNKAGNYFTEKRVGRGAAFGDYDNDGDVDIVISNSNQPMILLRNDRGNRNNWLKIKTIGTKSNKDGIGARIIITSGPIQRIAEVKSAYSYASANDMRVTFGLRNQTQIDNLEIRWPSGVIENFENIPANHLVIITEGAGFSLQTLN